MPPKEIDDFGWLESYLRLIWWPYSSTSTESIMIFCDNTINREANFLQPVIRHAKWERHDDIASPGIWPRVEISLSYLTGHLADIDDRVKILQAALADAPFVPFGLPVERNGPDLKTSNSAGSIRIESWNGRQTLEYSSHPLEDDTLTSLFFETFNYLTSIMQPIDRKGWREAYNFDLSYYHPFRSWYWSGNPPTIKKIQRTQTQEPK